MEIFSTVPAGILAELAEQSAIRHFAAGAVVFRKNDPGHALFLLLEGSVKIHDEDYTVASLDSGACFGELALLDEGPRSMSVTTTEATTLAVVERDVFFNVLRNEPEVTRKIVGMLTKRLRFQTDRVVEQLRQREQELTRLVDERTAELVQQKEEAEMLRAKAEAEKHEAEFQRHRAEQSEMFEQQFLANMSHEIRTPMNAVMGMTRILLHKNPRPDQLRYLESISNSSQALLVIINDILDVSKIQAGRMELEYTDFSPAQIVGQVVATLGFRAKEKELAFGADIDPDLPPVLIGDPVRLQQVLINLTGNAIKFTETGSVRIGVQALARDNGVCSLRFELRDTGIGMTPEQSARAFESFRQASSDTTRKYGGTGLGLSISKQLVELFGGKLEVASEPGKGSVFSFVIDLKISDKQSVETTAGPQNEADDRLRGLRILVAEDNEYNRIVALETLEMLLPGVSVRIVENGRLALEAVQNETFDLVLMDVNMPEMDGLEATRSIRALPAPLCDLPVVAFTASVTKSEVQKCYMAGMNAVVPKPFRENELLDVLRELAIGRAPGPPAETLPQAVSVEKTAPKTDLTFLEELTGGNTVRIRKYIGLYLDSIRSAVPRIEAALEADQAEDMRRAVHTLKPQFKMVGLADTAERAADIEASLLEGRLPSARQHDIRQLLEEIRRSADIFDAYLQQLA